MYKLVIISMLFFNCPALGQKGYVYTVKGKVNVSNLKFCLTHEHIMSNFGAPASIISQYDTAALFAQVILYLKTIKSQGINSVFDCTGAYFGRNAQLLKAIADSTGLHIITNTGYYGANKNLYVPEFVKSSTAEAIAAIWIAEFENGIDNSGIIPGFIKLAFDDGVPSEIDIKLFAAGIITHLKTGLTIVAHTGNNTEAASMQMRLLKENKVQLSAWVWTHANNIKDNEVLAKAAANGAWISLDGVKTSNIEEYINRLQFFKERKLLHKILLSHDGNSFPKENAIRPFHAITKDLLPAMRNAGFTTMDIEQILIQNPANAFSISIKNDNKK